MPQPLGPGPRRRRQLLDRLGVEYRTLDAGCCGMAAADTLILADGFSCRTQIETATSRSTVHLTEILHLAQFGG